MALGYQNPFYLKQAQQKQQSLYNGKVLLENHDPPAVYDSEEALQLAQESLLKMKQLNKEIKPENYEKINHLSNVFVSQKAKSREELYFSNTSKTASVSKSISIPNEEFLDDTTPSVAQKFLNELLKIVKDEIYPIVKQVDARVQNFKIQFLKKAAKFVRDFKSLANEKHKALEFEIERLLRAVTELERTKERFENCIIKKENECAKLWKDWCDTLDPLSQKLENENVELEFQVSEQKDTAKDAFQSERPKFSKTRVSPKVVETNDLSKHVTSNSVPTTTESKVMKNDNVIAPRMFRINPTKTSREDEFMPINQARASVRTNPI
ncbi:hypothetical protein Tco_1463458, partial [Tanacetum coccineum]